MRCADWTNRAADDGYLGVVARVLSRQSPTRLLASPPFGCLCQLASLRYFAWLQIFPCAQTMRPSTQLLVAIRRVLFSFVIGVPVLVILTMWSREVRLLHATREQCTPRKSNARHARAMRATRVLHATRE